MLGFLATMVLGPLAAEAYLIHDHHGHDSHWHATTLNDLDAWHGSPEHQHEDHEHDGQSADPPAEDNSTVVITQHLLYRTVRARGLSGTTLAPSKLARTPLFIANPGNNLASEFSPHERTFPFLPGSFPDRRIVRILLSNHALLL